MIPPTPAQSPCHLQCIPHWLRVCCISYAVLPVAVFLFTWVKALVGVPLACLAGAWVWREWTGGRAGHADQTHGRHVRVSEPSGATQPHTSLLTPGKLVALVLAALVWCVLGGQGNLWYQSSDWEIRNIIYHDLCTRSWPLSYANGGAVSYYIGHWLPPALLGRIVMLLPLPHEVLWVLCNLPLLLWTATGALLVELLLVHMLDSGERLAMWAVLFFIFFSTPDILGIVITRGWEHSLQILHLERWPATAGVGLGQYSCNTTCLFWVFNQAVVPWICTLLFLGERDFRNYLPLFACFFCGPLPSVGLAVLMLGRGIGALATCALERDGVGPVVRDVASPQNLLALPLILVLATFFMANSVSAVGSNETHGVTNLLAYPLWFPDQGRKVLFLFIFLEGLLLPLLVVRTWRKSALWWSAVVSLALFPFVHVGKSVDFCMRASIPALVCVCVMCAVELRDRPPLAGKGVNLRSLALALVLALGLATSGMEFYRSIYLHVAEGQGPYYSETLGLTFEGYDFSVSNFGTAHPEDTVFYRHLARGDWGSHG